MKSLPTGSSDSLKATFGHCAIPTVPGIPGVISVYYNIVFKEMEHSSVDFGEYAYIILVGLKQICGRQYFFPSFIIPL
jgi:hypothetical protein